MKKEIRTTPCSRGRLRTVLAVLGALVVGAALVPGGGFASRATAPKATGEPRILGTPIVGNTLTTTNSSWSGSEPMRFSYRWLRCPKDGGAPDGSNCGVIPNAAQSAYQVRKADVGFRLRARVTATNPDGSASSTSNPTEIVKPAAQKPVNTDPPTISGKPVVGQTLQANRGTWQGESLTFSYRWLRCDENGGSCSAIGGATAASYTLKSVDQGNTLRISVTATNSAGSTVAGSVPTAVVRPAAPSPPPPPAGPAGCPGGTGSIPVSQISAPARLLVAGQQLTPQPVTSGTTELTVRFRVTACGGRPVQGALVYATAVPYNQFTTGEQPTASDGWATVQMRRLSGFPATPRQQLLVMFVRARKSGEPLLGGISTRRLVSFRVTL